MKHDYFASCLFVCTTIFISSKVHENAIFNLAHRIMHNLYMYFCQWIPPDVVSKYPQSWHKERNTFVSATALLNSIRGLFSCSHAILILCRHHLKSQKRSPRGMHPPRDKLVGFRGKFVNRRAAGFGLQWHTHHVEFGRMNTSFASVAFSAGCYGIFPRELASHTTRLDMVQWEVGCAE